MKVKPVAVLISDVHYNIQTLPVADAAMRLAIAKANELDVPLIVAGDLHDTKANMRGECVSAMLKTFKTLGQSCYILRGNHDSINERSIEHSLDFLMAAECGYVIEEGVFRWGEINLIPYYNDVDALRRTLQFVPKGSTVIMHQGLQSSNPGDYIQDKSAITPEDVAGLRVISGHYHTRQTIELPDGGKWDYIGNPYTLNFAEANDPEKGFQILMSDGSLEFVPTNLRKHVVMTSTAKEAIDYDFPGPANRDDLVLYRVTGSAEELRRVDKNKISAGLGVRNLRLDIIPDETEATATEEQVSQLSQADLLDSMIESIDGDSNQKNRLKTLWKDLK